MRITPMVNKLRIRNVFIIFVVIFVELVMASHAKPPPAGSPKQRVESAGFGRFKVALSTVLTMEIIMHLAVIFAYPSGFMDDVRNSNTATGGALLMVMRMEERGQIAPHDISQLLDSLEDMGYAGTASQVRTLFLEHTGNSAMVFHRRLPPEQADKMLTFIRELKDSGRTLYDKIQPIPYIKEKLYSVDKVFIEVGMEHCDEQDDKRDSWKTLSSYFDIFSVAKGSSRIQIIEGDPGYGKSTLALQLLYDWCNERSDSPFSRPDVLIFLNLRQLGEVKSLAEAIEQFLLPQDSLIEQHDVEQLISNRNINVLVIFDAYDEYPDHHIEDNFVSNILEGKNLRHVDILLITRSSCIPPVFSSRTKRIRLTGFDAAAREQYVRKAVTGDDEEEVQKILEQFNTNPILRDICQAPLFSVMYAHVAHKGEAFHNIRSVTEFFLYMIDCFHSHAQNKVSDEKRQQLQRYADNHQKLDKVAYDSLTGAKQELVWDKKILMKKFGADFCRLYTDIGILVEEKVISRNRSATRTQSIQCRTDVRFYHKLFCEWYAAHHLVKNVTSFRSLFHDFSDRIDPYDLQFVYRFACGINPAAAKGVIKLVQKKQDGDKFAVLCALEQKDNTDDVLSTVRDLVSRDVRVSESDTKLLQRTTVQLLELRLKKRFP